MIVAVDSVPRLVICLEEEHVAKPESILLIKYLKEKFNFKAIIDGAGFEPEAVQKKAGRR